MKKNTVQKNKYLFIILFILLGSTLLFFLIPSRAVKADFMSISLNPDPVDFGHYVTLTWSCPTGNCKAVSSPSYSEWSGNITQKQGHKTILINKFREIKTLGGTYWGVKFELNENNGPGFAEDDLTINKDSLVYLIAIDNSNMNNKSTDDLHISKETASTKGISLQYSYARGTWQKVSFPNNSNWEGSIENNTSKSEQDLTNINPLTTSTSFCLGMADLELGTCVSVDIQESPPTPTSSQATISANPTWIKSKGSSTITWSSKNVDSCIVQEIPRGESSSTISTDLQGSQKIDNISTTTDFTIRCQKHNKTVSDKATVIVSASPPTPPPVHNITFYADPTSITEGDSTNLYWDLGGNDPTKCSPSSHPKNSQWESVNLTANGSTTISDLQETTNFYIICNQKSATTTVNVSNKQKASPSELIQDYFTRDIMSTQICNHVNNGAHQWDCDKDQEEFCDDYPKYILKNLHTFTEGSIKTLKLNSGCFNKRINTNNFLSILSGKILSDDNWLTNLIKFVWGETYSKYISNIDYTLRKAEVDRCLFDQCCIYAGKNENLNEVVEGTEEPKYPMTAQEVENEGAFLTKKEEENIRNLLDFFCCR